MTERDIHIHMIERDKQMTEGDRHMTERERDTHIQMTERDGHMTERDRHMTERDT